MDKVESIEHCLIECTNARALWANIFIYHNELVHLKARDLLYLNLDVSLDTHTFNCSSIIISTAIEIEMQSRPYGQPEKIEYSTIKKYRLLK